MFWKPESIDQRRAKRAGLRKHRELFPSEDLWGSSPEAAPTKVRAVNRWNGTYDHPKPKGHWSDLFKEFCTYVERLERRGFEKLGGGAFSHVYGKPGCSTVVKVCHDGDRDPWPLFAAWAHANPSPFLQTIHSFKRHKGFYVAVIERMERTVACTDHADGHMTATTVFAGFVTSSRAPNRVEQAVLGAYPGIQGVLETMRAEFDDKAYWDLHQGNWMIRSDGSLVITDPICARGDRSDASQVTRIKGSARRISA